MSARCIDCGTVIHKGHERCRMHASSHQRRDPIDELAREMAQNHYTAIELSLEPTFERIVNGNMLCVYACRLWLSKRVVAWLMLLASVFAAQSASVTLAWNANPETNILAYKVFWGRASQVYTNSMVTTNLTATVANLVSGATYYFAATAVTVTGLESDFCPEISVSIPSPPANFRVITNTLQGAVSANGPWQDIATSTTEVPTTNGMMVYRSKLRM